MKLKCQTEIMILHFYHVENGVPLKSINELHFLFNLDKQTFRISRNEVFPQKKKEITSINI